ncbi:HNH endonuclease [Microcoleus sp. POL10_C6]
MIDPTLQQRLENHIISKTDCWLTDLCCCKDGYPKISVHKKVRKASRAIFELYNGEISKGMFVLHKCDNPACINPEHLFLGTQKENMEDMASKSRSTIGSKSASAKLNEEQVLEIKRLLSETDLTQQKIAESFNVDRKIVSGIKNGKIWKHVIYTSVRENFSEAKQLSLFD